MKRKAYITPVTKQTEMPADLLVIAQSLNGSQSFTIGKDSVADPDDEYDDDPNASRRWSGW